MNTKCNLCNKLFKQKNKLQKYCSIQCSQKFWASQRLSAFPESLNIPTATVGSVSEMQAAIFFMRNGWDVFRAMSASAFCDLFILKRNAVKKQYAVEVRTAYKNLNGSIAFARFERDRKDSKIFCGVLNLEPIQIYLFDKDGTTPITLDDL
jgi:hypothetical protein